MALITLLRHAPLPLEYQKCFIGHKDIEIDLKLTDISKIEELKNKKFDLVFSSDLKRCTQTLDLIKVKYKKEKKLREVEFKKEFEAKNFKEIEKHHSYNEKYLSSIKTWHEYICNESFFSFENRLKIFLDELPKNKNILICSHAGSIKMMDSILKDINYENSRLNIDYLEFIEYKYN